MSSILGHGSFLMSVVVLSLTLAVLYGLWSTSARGLFNLYAQSIVDWLTFYLH